MNHANEILQPVASFPIAGRVLGLYFHANRHPSIPYSLYWEDEPNPIMHGMSAREVFLTLAKLLKEG